MTEAKMATMAMLDAPRLRDLPPAAWRVAILAGMASYLDAAAIITSGGALVLYRAHFGLSMAQIGQLSAVLTALFAIGAPVPLTRV